MELEAEFRGQADSTLEAMCQTCDDVVNPAGFSFGLRDRGAALAAERGEKLRAELDRRKAEEEIEAQFKGKPDSVLKQWLQSCDKVVQAASLYKQDVGAPASRAGAEATDRAEEETGQGMDGSGAHDRARTASWTCTYRNYPCLKSRA